MCAVGNVPKMCKVQVLSRQEYTDRPVGSARNAARLAIDARIPLSPLAPRSWPQLCDPRNQRGRLMGVQPVADDVPPLDLWCRLNQGLDLAGDDIPTENKRAGAMPDVLKFAPLHFSGRQRQARMFAFQGLHSSQFISTHRVFSLFRQCRACWYTSQMARMVASF